MNTHWFSKNKNLSKGLRIAGAALMALTVWGGPMAVVAPVEAKLLEWGDVRMPLTTDFDTDATGGFDALPNFSTTTHNMAIANNGDIFVAGGAAGAAKVYMSSNGGKNWKSATVTTASVAAAVIVGIVVSPDYPSDGFIAVVFNDGVAATEAGDNGICWVTAFPTAAGGDFAACLSYASGGLFERLMLRTVALSPDFNWANGNGEIAIGGTAETAATTVYIAQTAALKATPAVADFVVTVDATVAVNDSTVHLAYTHDEEPISLARLYLGSTAAATYGEILGSAGWAGTASPVITNSAGAACAVTDGQVAFDDEYSTGGSFFAAVTCSGAGLGGIFRFNGTAWSNKTVDDADCT
ncbi:MAG: hypothetical protein EXR52_03745, partial [Dehalococcoidia bacterium]|nr:hypothetical protein [Dehalococcoidia bacterium]